MARRTVERLFGSAVFLTRPKQPADELAFLSGAMEESALENKLAALEQENLTLLSRIRLVDY